jgi:hypothetical protein
VNVVNEIPAGMIGGVVNDKIIAIAIPAPIGGDVPIPHRNVKVNPAGEPEAAMVAVDSLDAVAERWADVFKVAVLERASDHVSFVPRAIVIIPVVIADMRNAINATSIVSLKLGAGGGFTPSRRFRNTA